MGDAQILGNTLGVYTAGALNTASKVQMDLFVFGQANMPQFTQAMQTMQQLMPGAVQSVALAAVPQSVSGSLTSETAWRDRTSRHQTCILW